MITIQHESPDDREEIKRRAIAAIGRFRSDVTDLAREHDRYLEEAFSGGPLKLPTSLSTDSNRSLNED
jgi:hypothetical protein